MSTTGVALIRYLEDYEVGAVVPMKKYLVNRANGDKSAMYVAYVSGYSVEFLIKESGGTVGFLEFHVGVDDLS